MSFESVKIVVEPATLENVGITAYPIREFVSVKVTPAAVGYSGITSTSNITIGTGVKTFTLTGGNAGAFVTGQRIRAIHTTTPTYWMEGYANYIGGVTLILTVDLVAGSGTHNAWNFAIAGQVGATGSQGPQGPQGPTGGVSSVAGRTGAVTLVSADITDATSANNGDTLVIRDGYGNFSASDITAESNIFASGSVIAPNVTLQTSPYNGILQTLTLSSERTYDFPDLSGTVALTNSAQSWSSTQTFSGAMDITNATASTTTTTGALKVAGGIGVVGAINVGGASSFTSTTRPTSSGTGTPAATSLITRDDGDTRYSRVQDATVATIEQTGTNTTTYVDSTQGRLTLGVGTYIIETWQQVEGTGAWPSGCAAKTKLRWSGTATASGLRFMAMNSTSSPYNANIAPIMAQSGSRVYDTEVSYGYSTNYGGINHLRFKFVVTVAGTLYIQFAPAAAVASQLCSLHAGSFLRATQIA
jgi:hypothetical protein